MTMAVFPVMVTIAMWKTAVVTITLTERQLQSQLLSAIVIITLKQKDSHGHNYFDCVCGNCDYGCLSVPLSLCLCRCCVCWCVCVCVCVCVRVCVYINVSIYIYLYIHICKCMRIYTHVHTYVYVSTYVGLFVTSIALLDAMQVSFLANLFFFPVLVLACILGFLNALQILASFPLGFNCFLEPPCELRDYRYPSRKHDFFELAEQDRAVHAQAFDSIPHTQSQPFLGLGL